MTPGASTRRSKRSEGEGSAGSPAPDELVEQNIPLVEHIVTRISAGFPSHFDREDLVQAGLLGLTQAARRFDPDRGIAFSTFVGRRIEGAILDVLRNADWAPRSVRASERALLNAESGLTSSLGRSPTVEELADEMGVSTDDIAELRSRVRKGVIDSLDRPVAGEAGSATVADTVADGAETPLEELETRELHAYLRDAIHLLPERHRVVVVGYFFEGRSITELGQFLGVTQSRASQIKDAALKMIRDAIEARDPEPGRPVSARNAAFAAAVASHSTIDERITGHPPSSLSRVI